MGLEVRSYPRPPSFGFFCGCCVLFLVAWMYCLGFLFNESTLCCVYCCVVAQSGFLLRFESRPLVASLEELLSHFLVLNYVKGWELIIST